MLSSHMVGGITTANVVEVSKRNDPELSTANPNLYSIPGIECGEAEGVA